MQLTEGMAAVVTGGASGLGKASAKALADLGLKVTIFDIDQIRIQVSPLMGRSSVSCSLTAAWS